MLGEDGRCSRIRQPATRRQAVKHPILLDKGPVGYRVEGDGDWSAGPEYGGQVLAEGAVSEVTPAARRRGVGLHVRQADPLERLLLHMRVRPRHRSRQRELQEGAKSPGRSDRARGTHRGMDSV